MYCFPGWISGGANLSEEAIIGAATLQKWRIKLDFLNMIQW